MKHIALILLIFFSINALSGELIDVYDGSNNIPLQPGTDVSEYISDLTGYGWKISRANINGTFGRLSAPAMNYGDGMAQLPGSNGMATFNSVITPNPDFRHNINEHPASVDVRISKNQVISGHYWVMYYTAIVYIVIDVYGEYVYLSYEYDFGITDSMLINGTDWDVASQVISNGAQTGNLEAVYFAEIDDQAVIDILDLISID